MGFLSLPCSVAYFNTLWITSGWVQWILIYYVKIKFLIDFAVCVCFAVLLISMHCALLAREFSEHASTVMSFHFELCCFYPLLLILMPLGLLACEFSEFASTLKSFHFVLCFFQFSIAHFNALWITSVWVQRICAFTATFMSSSFCALLFPFFIAYFNALWITSGWVQWIFVILVHILIFLCYTFFLISFHSGSLNGEFCRFSCF